MDYYPESASWPIQAEGHFVRYRKVGATWTLSGPYVATRASVIASSTFAQTTGITIDADSRLVFAAGTDVKAPDMLLWVEANEFTVVVQAHHEPTFVECFTKTTNKNTAAMAPWS